MWVWEHRLSTTPTHRGCGACLGWGGRRAGDGTGGLVGLRAWDFWGRGGRGFGASSGDDLEIGGDSEEIGSRSEETDEDSQAVAGPQTHPCHTV